MFPLRFFFWQNESAFLFGGAIFAFIVILLIAIIAAKIKHFPLYKYKKELLVVAVLGALWPLALSTFIASSAGQAMRIFDPLVWLLQPFMIVLRPLGELLGALMEMVVRIPYIGLPLGLALWSMTFAVPISLVLLLLYWLIRRGRRKKITKEELLKFWGLVISLAFISGVAFVSWIVLMFSFRSWCQNRVDQMHEFNAHLKATCTEAEDTSGCPQDEGQLRAFNPTAYDQIRTCTNVVYRFDPESQQYWFMVRWGQNSVLVFHPKFGTGGYALFYFNPVEYLPEGAYVYPPAFPGPWELMP